MINRGVLLSKIVIQGTGSFEAIANYVLPSHMDNIDCLYNS
jgi:hypothetical protein